jgi:hypothetical protein
MTSSRHVPEKDTKTHGKRRVAAVKLSERKGFSFLLERPIFVDKAKKRT